MNFLGVAISRRVTEVLKEGGITRAEFARRMMLADVNRKTAEHFWDGKRTDFRIATLATILSACGLHLEIDATSARIVNWPSYEQVSRSKSLRASWAYLCKTDKIKRLAERKARKNKPIP